MLSLFYIILYLYASFILKAAALNTLYVLSFSIIVSCYKAFKSEQMLDTWGPSKTIYFKGIFFFLTYILIKYCEYTCSISIIMNLPTDMGPYGFPNHKLCPVIYLILTIQLFSSR